MGRVHRGIGDRRSVVTHWKSVFAVGLPIATVATATACILGETDDLLDALLVEAVIRKITQYRSTLKGPCGFG
jgi:hypothetical protein